MSYAKLDESSGHNGKGAALHHHDDGEYYYDEERQVTSSPASSPALGGNSRKSLEEPLTAAAADENDTASSSSDPFYVFRQDLYRKLESVDESLAEYLRIVHQTVSETMPRACTCIVVFFTAICKRLMFYLLLSSL